MKNFYQLFTSMISDRTRFNFSPALSDALVLSEGEENGDLDPSPSPRSRPTGIKSPRAYGSGCIATIPTFQLHSPIGGRSVVPLTPSRQYSSDIFRGLVDEGESTV